MVVPESDFGAYVCHWMSARLHSLHASCPGEIHKVAEVAGSTLPAFVDMANFTSFGTTWE